MIGVTSPSPPKRATSVSVERLCPSSVRLLQPSEQINEPLLLADCHAIPDGPVRRHGQERLAHGERASRQAAAKASGGVQVQQQRHEQPLPIGRLIELKPAVGASKLAAREARYATREAAIGSTFANDLPLVVPPLGGRGFRLTPVLRAPVRQQSLAHVLRRGRSLDRSRPAALCHGLSGRRYSRPPGPGPSTASASGEKRSLAGQY